MSRCSAVGCPSARASAGRRWPGSVCGAYRLQQHLFRRHPQSQAEGAVTVVWVEPVVARLQGLTRSHQQRFVTSARDLERISFVGFSTGSRGRPNVATGTSGGRHPPIPRPVSPLNPPLCAAGTLFVRRSVATLPIHTPYCLPNSKRLAIVSCQLRSVVLKQEDAQDQRTSSQSACKQSQPVSPVLMDPMV